ncbi:MAG: Gldg family protein, partial [Planctomycetes bacterium]|nr:Gldg family protein [Planctomycetota bacterium]
MTDRKRSYTTHFLLMAVLTAAALASVNFLAMEYRARLDLTADQRFTLSEGTERLLSSLADPVVVTYYVDEEPPAKRINLERDVRDKLQELAASSGGKLEYKIERISNADVATKRSELEKKNITPVMDVLATGSDASAAVRGIQGYYSSLEVRHGAAEPLVINGVVNLVDEMDEGREHRVDTLEFDITFTVLQMRSKGTKAPLKRMLKSLSEPVQVVSLLTEHMPAKNPKLGQTIRDAMAELQRLGGQNVRYREQLIPWGMQPSREIASYATMTEEATVDPNQPSRSGPNYYFALLALAIGDREYVVTDLKDQTTVQQVLERVDPAVYELVKPRARLAMVLPPEAAPGMEGMGA